jgi:mono/diheme cytochrome c family protein
MPRAPARDSAPAVVRGARLYAAECADCHGVRREGWAVRTQAAAALPPPAPSLGAGGHAWRHSDAELGRIVAQGLDAAASPGGAYGMPGFADRLDGGDIDAILAYVKSRWPSGIRADQATLNPGGEPALAASLRDPAWVFPAQCPSPAIQE